jgi:hypothetical protein
MDCSLISDSLDILQCMHSPERACGMHNDTSNIHIYHHDGIIAKQPQSLLQESAKASLIGEKLLCQPVVCAIGHASSHYDQVYRANTNHAASGRYQIST